MEGQDVAERKVQLDGRRSGLENGEKGETPYRKSLSLKRRTMPMSEGSRLRRVLPKIKKKRN